MVAVDQMKELIGKGLMGEGWRLRAEDWESSSISDATTKTLSTVQELPICKL